MRSLILCGIPDYDLEVIFLCGGYRVYDLCEVICPCGIPGYDLCEVVCLCGILDYDLLRSFVCAEYEIVTS